MRSTLASSKWREFQESLARTLGLTLSVMTSESVPPAGFNAGHLSEWFTSSPALHSAYRTLQQGLWDQVPADQYRVFTDPLGLPGVALRLRDGPLLTLGGAVNTQDSDTHVELSRLLETFGISLSAEQLAEFPRTTSTELMAKAHDVKQLYEQLGYTLKETSQLGRRSLVLSAVEQINRLVLGTLDPEAFNLKKVLELAASSLVILLDAQVAWAFSSHRPYQPIMVWRGGGVSQLTEVCRTLEATWAQGRGIVEVSSEQLASLQDYGQLDFHHQSFCSRSTRLTIGVIVPPDENDAKEFQLVISSLLSPLAISSELSSLYSTLRRQVGTVINAIGHPVVVIDTAGRAGVINRAAWDLLGELRISIALGQSLMGRGLGIAVDRAIAEAVSGKTLYRESDRMPTGIVVNWSVTPLIDEDKTPAGAILVLEDVTEAATFRQRSVDWEKLSIAGQMAASLAHEIRSPLAAALGAIQLVRMPGGGHKREEVLARLETELSRMNRTLTDYLSMGRPHRPQKPELVDVCVPLREIEFLLRGEARLHNVDLVISVTPGELTLVNGDADALKQVFLNVGKNAFEAMPDGGRLSITLRRVGQIASIEFVDTGPGIPAELRAQVFRPFFTTKVNGTGLGLAVSRTIVRGMGGEISVEDQPGPGTKVVIQLPLQRPMTAGRPAQTQISPTSIQ